MLQYGKRKRMYKIHPHNECGICGELKVNKKTARQIAKKQIKADQDL